MNLKEKVIEKLKEIVDPEIGEDIVSAGLVKDVEIKEDKIIVKFAPTTPFCPLISFFIFAIREKIREVSDKEVEVSLTYD